MPTAPEFGQYELIVDSEGPLSDDLMNAIQNSWNAKTRSQVMSLYPSEKWDGTVYTVEFGDERKPPTSGGYVEGLVRHGWGYLYFDEGDLYVAPITDNGESFNFDGRENKRFEIPQIREVPEIEIDEDMPFDRTPKLRDQSRIRSLREDVLEVWPTDTLESIKDITYSTSDSNMYIINTESNSSIEEDEDGNHVFAHREIPDSPMGKHVDALLAKGWAVATVKSNSLFVSKIKPVINAMKTRSSYKFEGSEDLMYVPSVCDICEQHEYYEVLVTDTEQSAISETTLPVYARACKDCAKQSEYPTAEEYRKKESDTLEKDK